MVLTLNPIFWIENAAPWLRKLLGQPNLIVSRQRAHVTVTEKQSALTVATPPTPSCALPTPSPSTSDLAEPPASPHGTLSSRVHSRDNRGRARPEETPNS
jgi:hypothetical protein